MKEYICYDCKITFPNLGMKIWHEIVCKEPIQYRTKNKYTQTNKN